MTLFREPLIHFQIFRNEIIDTQDASDQPTELVRERLFKSFTAQPARDREAALNPLFAPFVVPFAALVPNHWVSGRRSFFIQSLRWTRNSASSKVADPEIKHEPSNWKP
jgi:hypothetical protein